MVGFPTIGDQIGAYRVEAEIGRGGMGIVYRATQLGLNRPVALKILDPRLASEETFAGRFSREAAILASLDSPHIIQIFDYGDLNGYLYLAMQYVAGGDVSQLVGRTGALPPAAAIQIFTQVLEALGDAHARGIVHRDVKPSNVLLRPGGTEPFAYLCDFGIAQTADGGLTQPGLVAGSWAFMSPERHAGRPATQRSDLYSAACVLWAMLTSRNVYSGTDVQVAMAHLNAPVPQLPGSDPLVVELNRLFWACLAKNPDERPETAAEVLSMARGPQSLAAGVAPLSISKPDSGIFRPAPRPPAPPPSPQAVDPDATRPVGAVFVPPVPAPPPVPVPSPALAPPSSPGTDPAAALPGPGQPSPAAPAAFVPAPPPTPARRRSPLVWLAGVAVLLVVALVAWAVTGFSGLRLPFAAGPATSPVATPSPTTTASPVAVVVQCWNAAPVTDLAECPAPSGEEGLRYVYLSLDEQWDDCTYVPYRDTTDTFDCTIGDQGLIRYRFWQDADEATDHYTTKYSDAAKSPMMLDGEQVGTLYRLNTASKKVYVMSGHWFDGHFSFSVEAPTIAAREALLELVKIRARAQLAGHEAGAPDLPGVLG